MTSSADHDLPEDRNEGPNLSEREEGEVAEHRSLSPVTVYAVILAEGAEELRRSVPSLWWSGIAAGVGISASVLAEGILHHHFEGHPHQAAIENLGYTVGFVLVILARLQLFTENTITVVLPVLNKKTKSVLFCAARLWAVVFAANMVGTFLTALITIYLKTAPQEIIDGMLAISHHYAELSPWECFVRGIPAGFFIAAIVWMLPSAKGFEIFAVMLFTYLIAMGEFTHVVAGSTEAFLLLVNGDIGIVKTFLGLIAPTFLGNVLGGTGLFALLAYGQVMQELDDPADEADRDPRKLRKRL